MRYFIDPSREIVFPLLISNCHVEDKNWKQVCCLSHQITATQVCVAVLAEYLKSNSASSQLYKEKKYTQAHLPPGWRCKILSECCTVAVIMIARTPLLSTALVLGSQRLADWVSTKTFWFQLSSCCSKVPVRAGSSFQILNLIRGCLMTFSDILFPNTTDTTKFGTDQTPDFIMCLCLFGFEVKTCPRPTVTHFQFIEKQQNCKIYNRYIFPL